MAEVEEQLHTKTSTTAANAENQPIQICTKLVLDENKGLWISTSHIEYAQTSTYN